MPLTIMLTLFLALLLVFGVAFSLLAGRRLATPQGDNTIWRSDAAGAEGPPGPQGPTANGAQKRVPLVLFTLTATGVISLLFLFTGGYTWLAGIAGAYAASATLYLFSAAVPLAGAAVGVVYYILHRARLRYFLLFWLNLAVGLAGFAAAGIAAM